MQPFWVTMYLLTNNYNSIQRDKPIPIIFYFIGPIKNLDNIFSFKQMQRGLT